MFHSRHAVAVASPRGAWGLYETSVGRYGLIAERLRVLPPDTTPHDRHLWAALRIWPIVGLLIAVVLAIAADPLLGTPASLLAAAVLWLGPLLWLWRSTRPFVARIHDAWAGHCVLDEDAMDEAQLRRLAAGLARAEARFLAGETDADQFRAVWTAAYREIDSITPHAA